MKVPIHSIAAVLTFAVTGGMAAGAELPGAYFRLLEAGSTDVAARLDAVPNATLEEIESVGRWRHFPYAVLAPAVLYGRQHPDNARYGDPKMRDLAIRLGDLLADEDERGVFTPRLDSNWDTYVWLEAYRLLEGELGKERKARWRKAILRNVAVVWQDAKERFDFPWYNSPYIGTSPNHYSHYANNLLLAGRVFGNKEWEELGAAILRRFSTVEQAPDGYWGEHSRNGPTTGYNYLTLTAVGVYWELTGDPAALEALRRATEFHMNFTYPNGEPVEVINDRNRYWGVSAWGHFAFSNFPPGRGYSELLTNFFDGDALAMSDLGRLAQNALYYHEGPVESPPQTAERHRHRMAIPAAIRKHGPWVVALSGIVDTQAVNSRFYLDRQGHLSLFHEETGKIITGANSKRQPELATFSETLLGETFTIPVSSRLQSNGERDRLSLAYNTFWADLLIDEPTRSETVIEFRINGKGRPADDLRLNLQLVLHDGEALETGAGRRVVLGKEPISLSPQELGGSISHHGWTIELDPGAELSWPVYPFNPYGNGPERDLKRAVGRLSVPLELKARPGHHVRPDERRIKFLVSVP